MNKYGFHFNKSTLGVRQGPNDSRREHFRGFVPAAALVREMGQNSLDAKDPRADGPVRMVFELRKVKAESIPDFENLSRHIQAAFDTTRKIAGSNRELEAALDATKSSELTVLRISDYNTTGLQGDEDDDNSALAALTRTSGVSKKGEGSGGSFGIGAATAIKNSRLLTVFWGTRRAGDDCNIIAGRSDLASHEISNENYDATGIYLDTTNTRSFQYRRQDDDFLGFEARSLPGTDTYIPGYLGAEDDENLEHLRVLFIENFFAAIAAGNIEVEGRSPESRWVLNSKTLPQEVESVPEIQPFYDALNATRIDGEIEGLGRVSLFVNLAPNLKKRYHTYLMRRPLMVVKLHKTSLRPRFAAVFICTDEHGNEVLRNLETPNHAKWVRDHPDIPGSRKIVDGVYAFIRDEITKLTAVTEGEEVELKGLKELLPAGLGNTGLEVSTASTNPSTSQDHGENESSTLHGDTTRGASKLRKRTVIKPRLRKPGDTSGDLDARGGNRSGRGSGESAGGKSRHTKGGVGEGELRVADSLVDFRFCTDQKTGNYKLFLKAQPGVNGDLTLCAIGAQGQEDFDLGISRVRRVGGDSTEEIEHVGNTLRGLDFGEETEMVLEIELALARRLKLGVD